MKTKYRTRSTETFNRDVHEPQNCGSGSARLARVRARLGSGSPKSRPSSARLANFFTRLELGSGSRKSRPGSARLAKFLSRLGLGSAREGPGSARLGLAEKVDQARLGSPNFCRGSGSA